MPGFVFVEESLGVAHRRTRLNGIELFYREAGREDAPAILLLHGFPASSHMFRDLMPYLHEGYRLIAPDLPGFGFSSRPHPDQFEYSFENFADLIDLFLDDLGLSHCALYAFDYGAPVAFRVAMKNPTRVTAIISQNGNAYEAGLSVYWDVLQQLWADPTPGTKLAMGNLLSFETIRWNYLHGVRNHATIASEPWTLDYALMQRPGVEQIQSTLLLDYVSTIQHYPAVQQYFSSYQPPLLAIWGKNDPFYLPAGALAFQEHLPNAQVHLLDTGHFALETHLDIVARRMDQFLQEHV